MNDPQTTGSTPHVAPDGMPMLIEGRSPPPKSFMERLSDGFWMLRGGSLR